MSLLHIVILSGAVLLVAYFTLGRVLARLLRLDPRVPTPAVALRDDVDFSPIGRRSLLSQHFSAIAAAGPVVGPILAGVMFGWLPALLWILIGSIFIGGVHDLTSLTASIRHKARSIAEVVREHMSRRSYILFMIFVWLALDYIIVAFTDITAGSFIGAVRLENDQVVSGPGIASSSLMYLLLPVAMGLLMRYAKLGLAWATVIFLPLVGVAIWAGQEMPLDLAAGLSLSDADARKVWNVLILGYCFVASLVPMWCLLQPRGHLGGYFLFVSLAGGALGLIIAREPIAYPAFRGWEAVEGKPLLPMLFITIACGACSGFHSIVASGTTSKQLRTETDAKLVGYGAMLMEGMVAVISLACVMRLAQSDPLVRKDPNFVYATGIGSFLNVFGVPLSFATSFALMAFTTFVYDTLDVCTRLGRYIIEELTGWRGRAGKVFAAVVTVGAPIPFLVRQPLDASGKPVAAWKVFWELFGASNQLLAALTLIGVTVWLWRTRRAAWVFLVCGVPTIVMYVMSTWALARIIGREFAPVFEKGFRFSALSTVGVVAVILIGLAALMLADAVWAFLGRGGRGNDGSSRAAAAPVAG